MRSDNGCWTCRLRRKKCGEERPICEACAALRIACCYGQEKPEWMDGGARQLEVAHSLKRQIREQGHRRHGRRQTQMQDSRNQGSPASVLAMDRTGAASSEPRDDVVTPAIEAVPSTDSDQGMAPAADPSPAPVFMRDHTNGTLDGSDARESGSSSSGWPDACLFTFYLENLLPFLFPFYRPSLAEGGRFWILDIMMTSPVVRQTALCQSSYFFSLALGIAACPVAWEKLLQQTNAAFETLRQSLQTLDDDDGRRGGGSENYLCEVVRTLAGVMQLQRFEMSVSSFENSQAHRSAAIALFRRVVDSAGIEEAWSSSTFDTVLSRLGTSSWTLPAQCIQVPSAEQAAFRFSSALVILDDIVASTVLQKKPTLYTYHHFLLSGSTDESRPPPLNLEAICGCQNWVLLQISEIAVLDSWKQECKRAGDLDVMELVRRAAPIKETLLAQLARLEANLGNPLKGTHSNILDGLFTPYYQSETPGHSAAGSTVLVTSVWANAALLYLFVVVSGWQPSSSDVRYHVSRVIELLTYQQRSRPVLLRTMVWPFCVAGCLARPQQEDCLRQMVEVLQPPSVFGTVYKALDIMEEVWGGREMRDVATWDLAACLRCQGDLVLLV
ncbi:hypothetical protein AYL99_08398 [Fonsecaea erecta]|uniref:Zn(2)-C6 fungal-type domain-containing protein n=1 Tax=Fonsecaea erecta TaxID=1367422 RepID=A0A178ZCY6_9EURO|nr:hypothetical protein AYL99_08398 [Fonsecaea erecta]OAP57660.1 hypothetical protein AYL99_08398 [Fonsecaea erecta]